MKRYRPERDPDRENAVGNHISYPGTAQTIAWLAMADESKIRSAGITTGDQFLSVIMARDAAGFVVQDPIMVLWEFVIFIQTYPNQMYGPKNVLI
jgi:hypothetical protein